MSKLSQGIVTHRKSSVGIVSDSTLLLTFKKLTLVDFSHSHDH